MGLSERGRDGRATVAWLVRRLAEPWPTAVGEAPETDRALGFLGSALDARTVCRACYTAATGIGLLAAVAAALGGLPGSALALCLLAVAGAVAVGGPRVPVLLASVRRSRALGAAPALVTRLTLRMTLSASPERAAHFATRRAEGPLARSLADHVRRARGGPGTGLSSFATEWKPWFPALERACELVEEAGRTADGRRDRPLDRAREAVLSGTSDRLAAFAAEIRGPATALYAFGVLLPLALVSLVPALQAAGLPASLPLVVAVYDLLLPAVLVAACVWLLARRPVAFPPPAIDRSHPDVPARRWPSLAAALLGGLAAWTVAARTLPPWTPPLAAAGCGLGSGLVVAYRPMASVREHVTTVEAGLADLLDRVGRRVQRGESVERALAAAAEDGTDATGETVARAARRQHRLGVGVEAAFLGPEGALAAVPSERAASAAAMLALAAREGRPAGETLLATSDHLDALDEAERETRRAVEQVTATLSNTAAVFAPLVGGATVALAGALSEGSGRLAADAGGGGLGLAVGAYVLVLAVLLTALATGLERGLDRSLVGYRAGLALLAATGTYLAAFVGAGLTVQV